MGTLGELFLWRCRNQPESLAYGFVRDNLDLAARLSYADLHRKVSGLVQALTVRVKSGDRVLLMFQPGLDVVSAFWAVILAGAVPVPVPSPDPLHFKRTLPRLHAIRDHADARLVLTTSQSEAVAAAFVEGGGGDSIKWLAVDQFWEGSDLLTAVAGSSDLAYLQYTSGSTATPRGVMIGHQNVLAQCEAICSVSRVEATSKSLCWLPYFHDYGLVHGILAPFYAGIPAYLMSPMTFLRRPLRWLDAIARYGITHSGAPNFGYRSCVRAAQAQEGWAGDLGTWLVASCGAEPIHADTIRAFQQTFASQGFAWQAMTPAYGLAEATLVVSTKAYGEEPLILDLDGQALDRHRANMVAPGAKGARRLLSCGKPIPGLAVRIVDPQTRAECRTGVVGEVWVAGSSIAKGYWLAQEADAAMFGVVLSNTGQGGYLRTGDLGFLHHGELVITGRLKDLMIVNGRNLYPQDVERTVEQAYPGLKERGSAVVSMAESQAESIVVLQEVINDQSLDLEAAAAAIRQAVMEEHEVPVAVVSLLRSGGLLRTSSGKIQRRASLEAFVNGTLPTVGTSRLAAEERDSSRLRQAPAESGAGSAHPDAIEALLHELCAASLGIGQSAISTAQPLVTLGLDSLKAGELKNRIEERFDVELSFSQLLSDWSIKDVAAYLSSQRGVASMPVTESTLDAGLSREAPSFPLSPTQRRLWFAEDFESDRSVNNVPVAVSLEGPLDLGALESSLRLLIHRHEALRTAFGMELGEPYQLVVDSSPFALHVRDLRRLNEGERRAAREEALATAAAHHFDLAAGIPLHAVLLKLGDESHLLIVTCHHLVIDGWSLRVLCRELGLVYAAVKRKQVVSLPPLKRSYRECLDRIRAGPGDAERLRQIMYWERRLVDLPPPTEIVPDYPRTAGARRSGQVVATLTAEQIEVLDRICRTHGVTRFMLFISALVLLLHRYTGSTDLAVGMPVSQRRGEGFEHVLGCFINTVLLRTKLRPEMSVGELLASVREAVVQANDHRDVPFDEVVRLVSGVSTSDRGMPFNIIAVSDDDPTPDLKMEAVRASRVVVDRPVTSVDLACILYNHPTSVQMAIEFDAKLYGTSTAERMLSRLLKVMAGLAGPSERRVVEVPLLDHNERQRVIENAHGPRLFLPGEVLHGFIDKRARLSPGAIAVMTRQGHLTYGELERRSNQLAQLLLGRGVTRGALVGLCMERSSDMIVALLGILKAGAAYVPIDHEYPAERLRFLIQDSDVSLVLTHSSVRESVPLDDSKVICLDLERERIEASDPALPAVTVRPDDLAYLLYTSGSSGEPKGVAVTHHNVVASTLAREEYYRVPVERYLLAPSLSFDASVAGIFWTLFSGGTLIVPADHDCRNPDALANYVAQFRATHVAWVPTLYGAILQDRTVEKLVSLRVVIVGGEPLPPELVRRHYRSLPKAALFNEYGPTETTVWACVHRTRSDETGSRIPIGRPIGNVSLYVLDSALEPVPHGVVGELWIGGASVALGYWKRADLTAAHFVPDPFSPGGRLYRTGDHARVDDQGLMEFIGRNDEQVNLRGLRIELTEVDRTLERIPSIEKAVTLVRRSPSGSLVLSAYVVLRSAISVPEVRQRAHDLLPGPMVPSTFTIVPTMPCTPSGKVDKRALLSLRHVDQPDDQPAVPARDHVEASLMEMWALILNRRVESVHDNFFDLGGHSLLATQLVSRVREVFDVEIPLRKLFDIPTVAALAELIRQEQRRGVRSEPLPPIRTAARDKPMPLSYSQQRMWFVQRLAPQATAYNMSFALRQFGRLNRQALRQTVQAMVERHGSLRTTFRMSGDGPVQVVAQDMTPMWGEVDLRRLPEGQRLSQAVTIVEADVKHPFDLERGPLVRILLIQLDVEDHVLVITMHHIIGDQWSFGVIGQEFSAIYKALCESREHGLPPLVVQYADYAVWQRETLTDERLRSQGDYWERQLTGVTLLALPTDAPRPTIQTFRGACCAVDIPASVIERLTQFSGQRRATSFMTLLACFYVLLSRYANQTDIAVGVPIANRTQVAVEGLIGTFVNTLVMRADVSGEQTFSDLVDRVRDTALDAYANQDFPFERLIERVHVTRDPSYPPLVQVLFNVANAVNGEAYPEGLAWAPFEIDPGASQVDLSLTVETELARKAYLTYNSDLFERRTAEQMLEHFFTLLHQALNHPQTKLSQLIMLTKAEQRRLVHDWNRTDSPFPREVCFPELFEAQVERTPDAVALSMGDNRRTYKELNARANQIARCLRASSVGPGVLVGVMLERSIESLPVLLGVMKAGGTYVPLDPEFPRARLRFMVEDSGIAVLVTSTVLAERLSIQGPRIWCLDGDAPTIDREADYNLTPAAGPDDVVYVLYTSGSTGQPKGVEIRHRSLVNFLWSMQREPGCTAADIMLSVTTLSFDIAGLELYLPLLVGGRVELASRAEVTDGRRLQACLERVRPTMMQATPATWRLLIDTGWSGDSRLKILCGGEPLPQELAERLIERSASLWNMYGPTETTIWSTLGRIKSGDREITIGRPIANTAIYIVDSAMQPVPVGVVGEIYIGGAGVAKGYRKRPDLTADRFVPHPFSSEPGARLYRTGDLARYRTDGRIVHLGRVDHQVKVRGFRIELGEIESVLSAHPDVRQAVVTAQDDRDGLKQLVAYIVARDGQKLAPEDLRALLRPVLPDYMVPSAFVFLDALPLTANNKIDLRSLPAPDWGAHLEKTLHEGPRNSLETQVMALWQQVLGVQDLGIHDNFFDRGGHSLKAAQLFFLLEAVFGKQLPLATLFQAPTIAELAGILSQQQWSPPWQSLVAIQPVGTRPPLFIVPGVGGNVLIFAKLAKQLGVDQPVYGLQARGLDGREQPFTSVTEMATHYVGEIQQVQPRGPYTLAGACTGGLIAYEMAQQLVAQGHHAVVLLMDTWHPDSYTRYRSRLVVRVGTMVYLVKKVFDDLRAIWEQPVAKWAALFRQKAKALGAMLGGYATDHLASGDFQVERVTQATFYAVANYAARPYRGPIINVVATERALSVETTDTRGRWQQLGGPDSQTILIPAEDSGRLFVSPHVEVLADHVHGVLSSVSRARSVDRASSVSDQQA